MHDEAIVVIARKVIRDYLAECLWEQAFIDVFNGVVHVFLRGGNTPLAVALTGIRTHRYGFVLMGAKIVLMWQCSNYLM